MTEFYFIDRENMPCIYEISWNKKIPALILKIHKSIIETCPNLYESQYVVHFMREFGFRFFDQFKKDLFGDLYFGFNGVFRKTGEKNNFWIFEIEIPAIKIKSNEACRYCEGTGEGDFVDGKCLHCDGEGVEEILDWKKINAISASFVIFFNLVFLRCEKGRETDCKFSQLILINSILEKKLHGGSLDGTYGLLLANFLASFASNTEIAEMETAMKIAWKKMFGKIDRITQLNIYANVAYENGWLNVSCPGNACGLHPADNLGPKHGRGYKFSCHNVDTAFQQITLIAGLAALCDKFRKENKK